jgi:hypothetical protein
MDAPRYTFFVWWGPDCLECLHVTEAEMERHLKLSCGITKVEKADGCLEAMEESDGSG